MQKYKVIALSCHSDLTQQIYNSGDIVSADWFHEGHAEKLADQGFLKAMTDEEIDAEAAAASDEAPVTDAAEPEVTEEETAGAEPDATPEDTTKPKRNKK